MLFEKDIVVADIGGTNATIALMHGKDIVYKDSLKTADIISIEQCLKQFMQQKSVSDRIIKQACIAVAGPLMNSRSTAQLTNQKLTIDIELLKKSLNIKNILLLNDFEALGLGIDSLKNEQYEELTATGRNPNGTIALIGAGTGLGSAILYFDGKRHMVLPSETGHNDITIKPDSKLELDLYTYLKKNKIPLEDESIVSGIGILNIYKFLLSKKYKHDKKLMTQISKAVPHQKPILITSGAYEEKDILCLKTMELFIMFYARAARRLALTTLCQELIIGGGIAPRILPFMKDSFLEAFMQDYDAEYRKILESITILVLKDPEVSLYGCYNALKMTGY